MIDSNMEDIFAGSVMSGCVIYALESDSVNDVSVKMQDNSVRSVVIMDGENMTGIFTIEDLVDAVNGSSDIRETEVTECMSENPVTVSPKDEISVVESRMRKNDLGHLPVTTEQGEVVGIISNSDISDYLPRNI